MHILQINNHHRIIGGSDRVYLNTGRLLESTGHAVSYFSARSDLDFPCDDAQYFCDAIDTRNALFTDIRQFLHNRDACDAINRMLQAKERVDIAHLHIYYGRLTASILKPLAQRRIPIVQSLHEYKLVCPTYTLERSGQICDSCVTGSSLNCVRYRCKDGALHKSSLLWLEHNLSRIQGAVRLIDRFICVSDFQRDVMIRAGIPENKLTTLHNHVDARLLQPKEKKPREDYVLYFGRIEKIKGLVTLLKASAQTNTKLKIAGVGTWSSALRDSIVGMPNVEYLEFVSGEALKQLVARARAVVVPSEWYETFGLTALEAKAVGTPVIASRIGGLTEVVRDGKDGFLFEPGSVDGLVNALMALDSADLDAMGAAGKMDVTLRFSPETHLARLLSIYSNTISC